MTAHVLQDELFPTLTPPGNPEPHPIHPGHKPLLEHWARCSPDQKLAIDSPRGKLHLPVWITEFWPATQRAAHSLHEISYRACFKAQLPAFFIHRLTEPGATIYDPFMGRGTTLIEAALLGRIPAGNDINPLSALLIRPRLRPPTLQQIAERLQCINLQSATDYPEDLLVFYHPKVLQNIASLRAYFLERDHEGTLDHVDDWIRMICLNRLTGHSPGFFSVYTLPPNQATSVTAQKRINTKRNQTPPERDIVKIVLKKSKNLLSECALGQFNDLNAISTQAKLITGSADHSPSLPDNSIDLVVTSPPFLNIVDYAGDNWLRCWFAGIDPTQVKIVKAGKVEKWQAFMTGVFRELQRILKPGGYVAFEVGEVRQGTIKLEEFAAPAGLDAGLTPIIVLVNQQEFTKTANCWGVQNGKLGTNSNRIVLFQKQ